MRFSIFLCFFFRMRLRRFFTRDPMALESTGLHPLARNQGDKKAEIQHSLAGPGGVS